MSEVLPIFRTRRSTRAYDPDRPVDRATIERCLEAARLAPSACNSQPWSFIVVDTPELKNRLAEAAFGGAYRMNRFAGEAPVLVVIVTERSRFAARLGGQWRGVQYNLIDIGIAGEHLVLQAEAEGLGTCWLGWFDERAVRKVLGLPRSTHVDILISLGYSKEAKGPVENRRALDEIRSYRNKSARASD